MNHPSVVVSSRSVALLFRVAMTLGAVSCTTRDGPKKLAPIALSATPSPVAAPSADGGGVSTSLPPGVLEAIVGCWQLRDRERWTIEKTKAGGARVIRALLVDSKSEFARRAARPSNIMFNPVEGTLAFSTAGPIHALLFVFKANAQGLEGGWATSHAVDAGYRPVGGRVTLTRCAGGVGP